MNKTQCINKANCCNKIVLFSGILALFLLISSTIVTAATTSSVDNAVIKPSMTAENPKFISQQDNQLSAQSEAANKGHKTGYKIGPVDRSHIKASSKITTSFPATYDLRTLGKVTPVKDQGSAGTCWAFATYGSLESYLMPAQTWDFSENNLKNVLSGTAPQGFDFSDGGNEYMSTAYLARWDGPVSESDDPYDPSSGYLSTTETGLSTQKHVQNVTYIPDRKGSLDNNNIKSAISNYGALFTTMYWDNACFNTLTNSYYYKGTEGINHAVAIVGWDDNYDKNKFSKVPQGNGAFIVKNSWGTEWGDNGYFYVSYYDSNIGKNNAMFTAEDTNNYNEIYQYDPLGHVTDVGYNTHTAWCANVFTADTTETLHAVSFYTTDANCKYAIYINNNAGSQPENQKGLKPDQQGTLTDAGYYTIKLNSGVQLKAGQNFSVVLKLTTPNYNYPIAIEMPISGYSSEATASTGQSFISKDGYTWTDIASPNVYPNTNVCIKAFS
jgi:C1A family cysteine protease